jgi:P pilus assembly chaperone PapD
MLKSLGPLTLLACFAATSAVAEMKLTVSPIDVKPKPEDETFTVSFTLKNEGSKPVKVLSMESS